MLRKTIQLVMLAVLVSTLSPSCSTYQAGNSGKVPPGKAKKLTGSKSAKPYAPGQQKKRK
jgi:hypothetical protein